MNYFKKGVYCTISSTITLFVEFFIDVLGFYCCNKAHDQKHLGKERIYLACTSTSQSITKDSQERRSSKGLDIETEAESMGGCCLLACSFWLVLSYMPQDHLPIDGLTHNELGYPTSNINHEKCPIDLPTDLPIGWSYGAFS